MRKSLRLSDLVCAVAKTEVDAVCLICKKPVEWEARAVFVAGVSTTGVGYGTVYNSALKTYVKREVKEGQVRIQFNGRAKPRNVIHRECWEAKVG